MDRRRKIFALLIVTAALLLLTNLFRSFDPLESVRPRTGSAIGGDVESTSTLAPRRPNFGYSVIRGGAWDAQELRRAIESDPVVADHYRDLDPMTMRAETVTSDRMAYVSYRVDDRVYWTKKKVRIRGGETILTNGQIEIRSRCGNCISMEPLLPTSADEPDESQLDALADSGPLLVSWNLSPTALPFAFGVPPGDLDDTPLLGPFVPVIPFGVPLFPGVPGTDVPIAGPPGGSPVVPVESPPIGSPTLPIGPVTPPAGGSPPVGGVAPGPSPLTPLVLEALLSEPSPVAPASPSSDVTAVPEPGTFLLLGGGIAGLLARRWRSRSKAQSGQQ